MQTFLPFPHFLYSAQVLDRKRLGKQRVEAMQILNTLTGKSNGWKHHPAVKMWAGYEVALWHYLQVMIDEWVGRGYVNNINVPKPEGEYKIPPWFGDDDFHRSHRSNLSRKDIEHYGKYWNEPINLAYKWPV